MSESKELATYEAGSMDERMAYARMIAEAGDLVPSGFHDPVFRTLDNGVQVKVAGQVGPVNPGKVFLAFEYGAMLGLHPLAALMGIHVIEGKPSASAGLISSLVRTAGHRLRVTTEGEWDDGTFKAIAELVRSDDEDFTFRAVWTKRDAERAGLLGKDNWKNYPRSMAKARAITEVAREGAEEALLGVHYTPEELGANVDANGEVIVVAEADHEGGEHAPAQAQEQAAPAPRRRAAKGAQGTKRKTSTAGSTTAVPMDGPETPQQPAEDIVDADVVEEPQEDPAEAAEREERARIAAEQEAAARAADAEPEEAPKATTNLARNADALEGETEPEYQHRKMREREAERKAAHDREMELAKAATEATGSTAGVGDFLQEPGAPEEPQYVDEHDGTVYESQEDLDAAIKARVQANQQARAAAQAADPQTTASVESWGEPEPAPADDWDVALSEEPTNWARLTQAAANQVQLKHVWDEATKAQQMTTELRAEIVRRKAVLPPA